MRTLMSLAAFLGVAAAARAEGQQLPITVRTGGDSVRVIEARLHASLHGGALKPRDPETAFLVVSFASSDAALDADRSSLATVATACGAVVVDGKTIDSDGGGLMDGKSVCNYIVPKAATAAELRLSRYPALRLALSPPSF
jgi:hypothetical protein